ncbi:MAG TPA: ribbon-helix-helix domain-containing protein [Actinomycetota bacterium]|nr:ribbon-helix-helix domain-containing protein [Actinomycetota bacterium]
MRPDEDVVLGERVRARKPVGAMLAVRLPNDLLSCLGERARAEETTLSDIVRRAIDAYLGGTYSVPTATTMTIPARTLVTLDCQSKTYFVFPDGTLGPGNWNPETGQVEPAR